MATVYRARDTRLERPVALKVMHPHLQGAREARQRFAREALTVARLRHPSILEIYDYSGEDSDISYIATELLTGATLKQFVEQQQEIPPEIAACIVIQVARALAAAHAEGVVHRDVKPENVMLHEDRCVKLADFGIAQLVDVQGMTTTGQVLGSPMHMAPEQIEGKECSARTDLFSLGTVLYMLATGRLPFTGQNPHQVLKRIMEGRYTDPQQVRPSIGGRLAGIIRRLLETDPDRRYQTAGELERELAEFVGEMGIEVPDEALAEYLADPEAFSAAFRERSIERLTELGERAQRRGSVPSALDYYNRVLALDDGNARVLAAVHRIGQRSQARRILAIVLAACMLVGVGVGAYLQWMPRAEVAEPEPPAPAAPIAPLKQPEQAPVELAAADPQPPPPPTSTQPVPEPQKPKLDRPRPGKKPVSKPRPKLLPNGNVKVVFKPHPQNVSIGIDGAPPRAFGPSFRQVELKPGRHRFAFVGALGCCKDKMFTVDIPAEGTFELEKRLEMKEAGLVVYSAAQGRVVVAGGKFKGRTNTPIDIEMRERTETYGIEVSADGYEDFSQKVHLQAGQLSEVHISMTRAPPAEGT